MREAPRTGGLAAGGRLPLVVFLGFLAALAPLSIDISLPALPSTGFALHAPDIAMQATLGGFMLTFGLGQLAHGPLADRFGRRPVALGGVALYTLAGIGCALAPNAGFLIAARVVQGFGACAGVIVARATARDISKGRAGSAALLGYINVVTAIAPIVAPLLGALILPLGWRAIYGALAVAGTLLLFAIAVVLPETLREPSTHSIRGLYRQFLQLPRSPALMLMIAATFSGMFSFISGSSFVLQRELGVPSGWYALAFASSAACLMLGSLTGSRLTSRIPSERLLAAGSIAICAVGIVAFAADVIARPNVAGFLIPMASYAFAYGFTMPHAFAAGLHDAAAFAGTGVAVLGTAQMLGGTLGSVLVGTIPALPAVAVGSCVAVAGALSLFAYLLSRLPERRAAGEAV